MKSVTTSKKIRVSIETRTALKALGRMGETYDAVIRRLIKNGHAAGILPGAAPILDLFDLEEEVKER